MWACGLSDQHSRSCLCRERSRATAALRCVSLGFLFSFFWSGGQNLLGDLFLKRKFLFRNFWAGGLGVGGGVVVAASIVKEIALFECEVTRMCVSVYLLLSEAAS